MNEEDELDPSFIDHFSKYIANNADIQLENYLETFSSITYSEFAASLQNLHSKSVKPTLFRRDSQTVLTKSTNNVRKNSDEDAELSYSFTFEPFTNSITFLLDLSPYMLIYECSSKSLPILVMENILKNMINVGLQEHYKERKHLGRAKYNISVFGFSTYTG